jgi:hypothetical protein
MEDPLSICIKDEIRGVNQFLFAEGDKSVQAQNSDICLSCSKIYEWIDHLKKRRSSLCDGEISGRLST